MRFGRTCLAVAAALLLGACASTPQTAEEQVSRRAQARMDALVAKDFKLAYGYFTPAYRDNLSYDAWLKNRMPRADYVSGQVLQVECASADVCDVELESVYRSPVGVRVAPKGEIARAVPQRWVRIDGQWWLYQRK